MTDTTTIFARLEKAEQDAARWRELSEAEAQVDVLRQDYARSTAAQAKADANSAKDAADDRAVAGYNVALATYLETGDDSDLRSIAPTIAHDMIAQAARDGDAPPEFSDEMDGLLTSAAAALDGGGEALPDDMSGVVTQ